MADVAASRRWLTAPRLAGIVGVALLVLLALLAPVTAAAGGLAAWLFALSAATGAAVWLLISRLTGGVWIEAGRGTFERLSRTTPLIAAAGLLLLVAGPVLYPWWAETEEGRWIALYLSPLGFALRSALVLGLWSAMGVLAPKPLSQVSAALLLTLYGISVGFAGIDWVLSRDPDFLSTTFGGLLGVMQLALALAVAAVVGLADRPRAVADWGGLMLAAVLGVFYLSAMQFLVSWSGNLPIKAGWFLARSDGAGTAVMMAVTLIGGLLPFAVLMASARRANPRWLTRMGWAILAAGYLYWIWLAAPEAMLGSAFIGLVLAGLAGLAAAFARGRDDG